MSSSSTLPAAAAGHVVDVADRRDPRGDLARRPAARSGCRRRGRPCSRCPAAGCGSRSPSRRPRSPSSRIANASSGVGSGRGSSSALRPAPVSTAAVSVRRRRSRAGRRTRSRPGRRRRHRSRAGSREAGRGAHHDDPVHPVRTRRRGRPAARRCRTPASRRTGRPGRALAPASTMIASSSARVCSSGSSAAQARARSSWAASGWSYRSRSHPTDPPLLDPADGMPWRSVSGHR